MKTVSIKDKHLRSECAINYLQRHVLGINMCKKETHSLQQHNWGRLNPHLHRGHFTYASWSLYCVKTTAKCVPLREVSSGTAEYYENKQVQENRKAGKITGAPTLQILFTAEVHVALNPTTGRSTRRVAQFRKNGSIQYEPASQGTLSGQRTRESHGSEKGFNTGVRLGKYWEQEHGYMNTILVLGNSAIWKSQRKDQ